MVAALFFEKAEIEIGTELRVTSWLGATGPVPQTPPRAGSILPKGCFPRAALLCSAFDFGTIFCLPAFLGWDGIYIKRQFEVPQ